MIMILTLMMFKIPLISTKMIVKAENERKGERKKILRTGNQGRIRY